MGHLEVGISRYYRPSDFALMAEWAYGLYEDEFSSFWCFGSMSEDALSSVLASFEIVSRLGESPYMVPLEPGTAWFAEVPSSLVATVPYKAIVDVRESPDEGADPRSGIRTPAGRVASNGRPNHPQVVLRAEGAVMAVTPVFDTERQFAVDKVLAVSELRFTAPAVTRGGSR